jgi:8-oxo-dGTP pyrophosphatase MutT (NUDIX family)/phosphohistidine phosphatase SixA
MSKKKNEENKQHDDLKNATVIEAAGAVIFRNKTAHANEDDTQNSAKNGLNNGNDATGTRDGVDDAPSAIVQAGAVAGPDGLEILLEHRAKYDDWSIPKGKVDPRESLAHTAVREVAEETGVHIRLSAKIAEVSYPLHMDGSEGARDKKHKGGKHHRHQELVKHVTYWAGVPISQEQATQREQPFGHPNPKDNETDRLVWLGLREARERLSYPDDRKVLDAFADFVTAGGDHAATLVFVRHGAAERRKHWSWQEELRPLTPKGAAESLALAREIACYAPSHLFSSPWRRCRQSLEAYSAQSGIAVEDMPQMTEDAALANPPAAVSAQEALVAAMAGRGLSDRSTAAAAVCLHRPVLGLLLPLIADAALDHDVADRVPDDSPWLATSTGLAVTFTRHEGRLVVLDAHPLTPVVY